MAHHQRRRERERLEPAGQRLGLRGRKAVAPHAGVDMDGGRELLARRARERVPFVDFGERAQHRLHVDVAEGGGGARMQPVQHIDGGFGQHGAQLQRLVEQRDEESIAARPRQRAHRRLDAEAVGVGLDHRGAARRRRARGEVAIVRGQRRQIDREDAAGFERGSLGAGGSGLTHAHAYIGL